MIAPLPIMHPDGYCLHPYTGQRMTPEAVDAWLSNHTERQTKRKPDGMKPSRLLGVALVLIGGGAQGGMLGAMGYHAATDWQYWAVLGTSVIWVMGVLLVVAREAVQPLPITRWNRRS